MQKWLKKLEVFVDKFIPYLIILLLFVIIIDLFYHDIAEHYKFQIALLDGFIVLVFLIDLSFKFKRAASIPQFLKKYWLEILAVLPFYLLFRALEIAIGFLELSGIIKQSQNILHTGVEIEKEISLISKEAEEVEKVGARAKSFARTFKSISRAPRLLAASSFYESPENKLKKKKQSKRKNNKKNKK